MDARRGKLDPLGETVKSRARGRTPDRNPTLAPRAVRAFHNGSLFGRSGGSARLKLLRMVPSAGVGAAILVSNLYNSQVWNVTLMQQIRRTADPG
jgi:hypothetical protein